MTSFVNTIREKDYVGLEKGVERLEDTMKVLNDMQVRCEIGHIHRFWEYGSAIALLEQFGLAGKRVLDVGAGWSPLGPTLVRFYGCDVTEAEVDINALRDRQTVNALLSKLGCKTLNLIHTGVQSLPREEYDAVFCISVLEHVDRTVETTAWRNLAERVKPGGLLFITVDCMDTDLRFHTFDNLRQTKYTMGKLSNRIEGIKYMGFQTIGEPDYAYHGDMVYDYSFFRAAFTRPL